jgi:hypothetical protein
MQWLFLTPDEVHLSRALRPAQRDCAQAGGSKEEILYLFPST